MDSELLIIKVRHLVNGELAARKLPIHKNIKLDELEHKLRERFEITNDKKIVLCYEDGEDRVIISYDDELILALALNEKLPTFELIVKPKVIGNTFLYPQQLRGNPGELVDVWIASQYLTISHALSDENKAWGTSIFTDDSDLVKALSHSEKLELSNAPTKFNVVATIRFLPGCIKYLGSTCNGITTHDYGAYGTSYVIEGVRMVPLIPEKNNYL